MNELGKKIYFYRRRHELSQKALAQIIGINRCYLNQIENGKKVPSERTEALILQVIN